MLLSDHVHQVIVETVLMTSKISFIRLIIECRSLAQKRHKARAHRLCQSSFCIPADDVYAFQELARWWA